MDSIFVLVLNNVLVKWLVQNSLPHAESNVNMEIHGSLLFQWIQQGSIQYVVFVQDFHQLLVSVDSYILLANEVRTIDHKVNHMAPVSSLVLWISKFIELLIGTHSFNITVNRLLPLPNLHLYMTRHVQQMAVFHSSFQLFTSVQWLFWGRWHFINMYVKVIQTGVLGVVLQSIVDDV